MPYPCLKALASIRKLSLNLSPSYILQSLLCLHILICNLIAPLSAAPISDMLLPSSRLVRPSMPLNEFCSLYKITETVRQKLDDEGYTDAHLMQYVSVVELKEAGLKNREVASLKYAVVRWSVPNK